MGGKQSGSPTPGLHSRRGTLLAARFPEVVPAVTGLGAGLVIDGELVALRDGRLEFAALQGGRGLAPTRSDGPPGRLRPARHRRPRPAQAALRTAARRSGAAHHPPAAASATGGDDAGPPPWSGWNRTGQPRASKASWPSPSIPATSPATEADSSRSARGSPPNPSCSAWPDPIRSSSATSAPPAGPSVDSPNRSHRAAHEPRLRTRPGPRPSRPVQVPGIAAGRPVRGDHLFAYS